MNKFDFLTYSMSSINYSCLIYQCAGGITWRSPHQPLVPGPDVRRTGSANTSLLLWMVLAISVSIILKTITYSVTSYRYNRTISSNIPRKHAVIPTAPYWTPGFAHLLPMGWDLPSFVERLSYVVLEILSTS